MLLLLLYSTGAPCEACGSHHRVLVESCRKEGRLRNRLAVKVKARTHLESVADPAAAAAMNLWGINKAYFGASVYETCSLRNVTDSLHDALDAALPDIEPH